MAKRRRKHRRRGLAGPPPLWVAQVEVQCPEGMRLVKVLGPSSAAAVRKGLTLEVPPRCQKVAVRLTKRGPGASVLDGTFFARGARRRA